MGFCGRSKDGELTCGNLDRMGFMGFMLNRSFLVYRVEGQSSLAKCLRIMRTIFLMAMVFYQMSYVLYFVVTRRGENIERSMVKLNWLLQAFISMCFIIYWQCNGHLKQLMEVVPWKNTVFRSTSALGARICKAFLVFWGIFLTCLFTLVLSVAFEFFIEGYTHYDPGLLDAYGSPNLKFISYAVSFYAFSVWNIAMALYIVVSLVVHQEIDDFNKTLIELGNHRDREEVAEQLLERYVEHVELANTVRIVDNAFEVYTFMMLGTNIPTTIFTLLSFYHSWGSNWYNIILSVPELLFCVVQITGLTLQPARVFGAIRQVESIIYSNFNIWMPFNEKVYSIANVFIRHAIQTNLGISVWGFSVITKPLILTTTSLTVTYLTLLIQMNNPQVISITANNTIPLISKL